MAKGDSLIRELGLSEALSIGLGTMIGAGIFVLSGIAAEEAGPAAALSYVAAGFICLPIAMTISELATGMPRAGGSYHLISHSLGPLAGAVVGLGNWLGLTFATGFYLLGFGQYISYFLPIPWWAAVLAGGALFTYLNYRGTRISGRIQNLIVMALMAILLLFVGKGLLSIDPQLHRPFFPYGWRAALAVVGLIIVSFTGFEKVSTVAEEIKRPGRNLPLAIVGSVIIATLLYGLILFVMTGILSYREIGLLEAPLVEAADLSMGRIGGIGISLAALLATASSANAAIMASSRIIFAMGRDRIMPSWFNEIHVRHLTPYRSILVTGGLATLLAIAGQAEVLAEISSALFMVSYALLSLSCIVMREARPLWYKPAYRLPLYPWLPIVGGALCLFVITTMASESQVAGLVLVLAGVGWYYAWARGRTEIEGELTPLLARERPLERVVAAAERMAISRGREILISVANPATVRSLIRLASTLAKEGTKVIALKVVPVPSPTPLWAAQEYIESKGNKNKALLRKVKEEGQAAGIQVDTFLRAARSVSSGILSFAEARGDIGLILLGWRGPMALSRIRESTDKAIVGGAKSDVAVLRDRGLGKIDCVLIPFGGGPHARLGLLLARDMMTSEGAELVVLKVVPEGKEVNMEGEMLSLRKMVSNVLGGLREGVTTKVVRGRSVEEGILAEIERSKCDLVVIGASEEWFFKDILFGTIPDIVAERAPCSVLMVRKYEPSAVSWARRVFKRMGSKDV